MSSSPPGHTEAFTVTSRPRSNWLAYVLAVVSTGLALLLSLSIAAFNNNPLFALFVATVCLSTFYGGKVPGLLSLILSAASLAYLTSRATAGGAATEREIVIRYGVWFAVALPTWAVTAALFEAREAVKRSEIRFAGIVQISEDAIISVNGSNCINLFNAGAEKIFGYAANEVLGKPLNILIPARFHGMHDRHVQSFATSRDVLRPMNARGTIHALRRDGTEFPAEASISKFEVAGEKMLTVRLRDVSERRKAEEGLLRLAAIVESSQDAIVGKSLQGIITDWNRGAERIYGWSAAEVIGKSVALLYPPERVDELEDNLTKLKRGEGIEAETVRLRKDGERIEVLISVSPIRNAAGELTGASTITRDITDRKRSERELAQSLSLLRATLESTGDGILVVNREGKIVTYNNKFVEMWHIPQSAISSGSDDEALAVAVQQLRDPEASLHRIRELYERQDAESYDLLEFKDGRVFERYSQPQRVGGEIVGRVWSFRDVSERKRLEAQLRQSQKMEAVGRLAGGVAHDFNNLLNVIIGYTYLLTARLDHNDESLRGNAEQVLRAAERATGLTRQLLAFSRKQVLQPEVLNLNDVVSGMGKMLPRMIGEDVDLRIFAAPGLHSVRADPGQIEQVIMNLVINARDAMPEGGKLTIETRNTHLDEEYARTYGVNIGDYVMLAVSDTGHGMDAETRSRIFEPFFTTKESGKGTGLGLAMVYGIVNQSGGHIWVYSEPGEGTTFKIYLPRVAEAAPAVRAPKGAEGLLRGSETVLLVEDEESMRKLVVEVLTAHGYKVLQAADGASAIRESERHRGPIHLLLTDVVMPGMRGQELASKLIEARPHMKIVFMSGYTDNALLHHGSLEQGTILLQKPFTPDALLRKLREVLGEDEIGTEEMRKVG